LTHLDTSPNVGVCGPKKKATTATCPSPWGQSALQGPTNLAAMADMAPGTKCRCKNRSPEITSQADTCSDIGRRSRPAGVPENFATDMTDTKGDISLQNDSSD
jgi:hypothetical protein